MLTFVSSNRIAARRALIITAAIQPDCFEMVLTRMLVRASRPAAAHITHHVLPRALGSSFSTAE